MFDILQRSIFEYLKDEPDKRGGHGFHRRGRKGRHPEQEKHHPAFWAGSVVARLPNWSWISWGRWTATVVHGVRGAVVPAFARLTRHGNDSINGNNVADDDDSGSHAVGVGRPCHQVGVAV